MDIKTLTNARIVQASYTHTGSTLLFNILQGFFYPNEGCRYIGRMTRFFVKRRPFDDTFILKTHHVNPLALMQFVPDYDLYFITSVRENHPKIELVHPKLLEIDYKDLLQSKTNSIENIVNNVAEKCKGFLPDLLTNNMNISASIERVHKMNQRRDEMKHLSFKAVDKFYGVHGSHQGRVQR